MLPYFEIFNAKVPLFNLLIGVGAVMGILLFYRIAENKISESDADNIILLLVVSVLAGFISGMLFDKIVHFKSISELRQNLFNYTGLTFIGGFSGGLITFSVIYKQVFKSYSHFFMYLDIIAPPFSLAQGIGRLGCLAGGCCFGKPSVIGFKYPVFSEAYRLYGNVRIFPVPLIESLFLILLSFILLKVIKKNNALYYIFFYCLFRFFMEFLRGDNRGRYLLDLFSPSQVICIILMFATVICVILLKNIKHNLY